jgi:hypothetical protein
MQEQFRVLVQTPYRDFLLQSHDRRFLVIIREVFHRTSVEFFIVLFRHTSAQITEITDLSSSPDESEKKEARGRIGSSNRMVLVVSNNNSRRERDAARRTRSGALVLHEPEEYRVRRKIDVQVQVQVQVWRRLFAVPALRFLIVQLKEFVPVRSPQ